MPLLRPTSLRSRTLHCPGLHPRRLGPARLATAAVALALAVLPAAAEDTEHRQLGPHVHGHGTLNIAFEGGRVSMELEAPGQDVIGFEHEAMTEADKATLDAATAKLRDGLALFKMPTAAGCKLVDAKISFGEDDEEDTKAADGKVPDGKAADHGHAGHDHGADEHGPYGTVNVDYELSCTSLAAIDAVTLDYFKAFPGARSLTVNVVTPRAQSAFEVGRDKPVLDLGNLK